MGRRGPAPTRGSILKLKGSRRAKTRETTEPKPPPGRPKCPAWLDVEAKRRWRQLAPVLERLGILTSVDGDALASYCQALAEFRHATESLQKDGRVLKLANGCQQSHPCVAQQRSAWESIRRFSALFGLDPANRSRVQVPQPARDDDELERFLQTS